MLKIRNLIPTIFMIFSFISCASLQNTLGLDADRTADAFFIRLQSSDARSAHDFLARGLSERVSTSQLANLISTMKSDWGMLVNYETVLVPFHERKGERSFIPLNVDEEHIKRYIFELKFDRAEINCDLTLALQEGQYKIVWISFWGSSLYMTPAIEEILEEISAQD